MQAKLQLPIGSLVINLILTTKRPLQLILTLNYSTYKEMKSGFKFGTWSVWIPLIWLSIEGSAEMHRV